MPWFGEGVLLQRTTVRELQLSSSAASLGQWAQSLRIPLSLAHLPVLTGPMPVAQLAPKNLAGTRFGQAVDELDLHRFLVAGEVFAALIDNLLRVELKTGSNHDHGLDGFSPSLVRHANDDDFA